MLFQTHPEDSIPNANMGGITHSDGDFTLAWELNRTYGVEYFVTIVIEDGIPVGMSVIDINKLSQPPRSAIKDEHFADQSSEFSDYYKNVIVPNGALTYIFFE